MDCLFSFSTLSMSIDMSYEDATHKPVLTWVGPADETSTPLSARRILVPDEHQVPILKVALDLQPLSLAGEVLDVVSPPEFPEPSGQVLHPPPSSLAIGQQVAFGEGVESGGRVGRLQRKQH